MKILSITFKNLNSIKGHQTIDFEQPPLADAGLFAITGDTGAGKTTILDALTLGLYGRVHRNKNEEEVMTYGEGECSAEVVFRSKRGLFMADWKLVRARSKPDGKLQPSKRRIAKWDEEKEKWEYLAEKKRDVDEEVEKATGLDYNRFCRSVLLSQGDFAAFLKSNEKERSELLERITGTEIYTQISIAAFNRNKLEMEKLTQLQQQLAALEIMDDEAEQALREEQKSRQTEIRELEQTIKDRRIQFEVVSTLEKGGETLLRLKEQQQILLKKKEDAGEDLTKLEAYAKTQPFLPLIETQKQTTHQIEQLNEELRIHQKQIPLLREELSETEKKYHTDKESLVALQSEFQQAKPLWTKVEDLDKKIDKLKDALERKMEDLQPLQEELHSVGVLIEKNRKQQEDLKEKQKKITRWLKEHKAYAHLKEDNPLLERLKIDLRRLFKERKEQQQELEDAQAAIEESQKAIKRFERELEQKRKQFEKGKKQFEQKIGTSFLTEAEQIKESIQSGIDQLQEEIIHLRELHSLAVQYRDAIRDFNEREDEFHHLLAKEAALTKDLMSLDEMRAELARKRDFKRAIFEQQQSIANYEKDRANLKEGAQCPLCFSTEHPFRKQEIKPFVDEARTELEQVETQYQLIEKEYKKCLNQHLEVYNSIESLTKSRKEAAKMIEVETKIARLGIQKEVQNLSETTPDILEAKIKEREQTLLLKRTIKSTAEELTKRLVTQSQQIRDLEQQLSLAKVELEGIVKNRKQYEQKYKKLEKEYLAQTKVINKTLKRYNYSFDLETAREMFQMLEQYHVDYTNQQTEKDRLDNELMRLSDQLKSMLETRTKALQKEKKLRTILSKEQKEFDKLTKERTNLFGTDDPAKQRESKQDEIDRLKVIINRSEQEITRLSEQIKAEQARLTDKKKLLAKAQKTLERTHSEIESRLQKFHFKSVEEVLSLALTEEEYQRISRLKEALREEETLLSKTLQDTQLQIDEATQKRTDDRPLEAIKQDLLQEEKQLSALREYIGGLKERLKESSERRKRAKKLVTDIGKQKKACARWSRLNEIIGQADGKKFRIFAQGLTLQQLVNLANRHLMSLQERYYILKPEAENLSLAIVDTYHADNQRSMNTLSGGESFLVSLALALGLSDLAGQNTRIESLFIDEGFGSLDDNTLDLAISTLENLKSSGKSIGIISHVASLKERMNTQIRVEKGGNGFSTIQVGVK